MRISRITLVLASAWVAGNCYACSDDDLVSALAAGTKLEITEPIDLSNCGDQSIAELKWINQKWYCSSSLSQSYRSSWRATFQRYVSMTIDKSMLVEGKLKPQICTFKNMGEGDLLSTSNCPIMYFYFHQAVANFLGIGGELTIGSLKYNLGPKFRLYPICKESANSSASNQTSKNGIPEKEKSGTKPSSSRDALEAN